MNKSTTIELDLDKAIETLAAIADVEISSRKTLLPAANPTGPEKPQSIIQTIDWLTHHNLKENKALAKKVFQVIYHHIKNQVPKYQTSLSQEAIEKAQKIMVIAGEGAKKWDEIIEAIYQNRDHLITNLKEFKQLESFYTSHIAKKVGTYQISKWIFGLATTPPEKLKQLGGRVSLRTDHVFVDLDSVKKDTEYELFYLRKNAGGRFFNPKLIRNMSLVCDYGEAFAFARRDDPVEDIHEWHDKQMRATAREILDYIRPMLGHFYKETTKYKKRDFIGSVHMAIMALMMSANSQNCYNSEMTKSCFDYFADFLFFMRHALCSRDYQKILVKPSERMHAVEACACNLLHAVCYALFMEVKGEKDLYPFMDDLAEMAIEELGDEEWQAKTFSEALEYDYKALKKVMRFHAHGPLVKLLEALESGANGSFDPLWQYSIPSQIYSLCSGSVTVKVVRMASPTYQDTSDEATVAEEFRGLIYALKESPFPHHHLIINLQDRTSWREYARCLAVEELQKFPECEKWLSVVTFPKDTEFYYQEEPYHEDYHADVFIQNFKAQLEDDRCGFYFPPYARAKIDAEFTHLLFDTIHHFFFGARNVLTHKERLDFIEISYLFLELKVMDIYSPESMSIICKDGADVSAPANVLLWVFLKLIHSGSLTEQDRREVNRMLYVQPLLLRERVLIQERFDRMLSALWRMESLQAEMGATMFSQQLLSQFQGLYENSVFHFIPMRGE